MNELTNEKIMTIKEVADALNVTERTIQRYAADMGLTTNGLKTFLTEKQVTEIKLWIERSGRHDLDNVVELPKTDLEKELLIERKLWYSRMKKYRNCKSN